MKRVRGELSKARRATERAHAALEKRAARIGGPIGLTARKRELRAAMVASMEALARAGAIVDRALRGLGED